MQRTAVIGFTFLLVAVVLAGCTGNKSGTVTKEDCKLEPALCDPDAYLVNHPCITNNWTPRIYAPDTPGPEMAASPWKQGDYWTYRLTLNGAVNTTTLVYYDDSDFDSKNLPQHYLVGTSREQAVDHALFSINPMLGRIHRTLYSPHESGIHSDMFFFPLCPGSSWQTGFYSTAFQLKAQQATLDLPGGKTDTFGFRMMGTSSDGSTLVHTYSPMAKWFTTLQLRRADGLTLDLQLLEYGSGKSGQFHFLRGQQDHVLPLAGAPAETTVSRDGNYDLLGVYISATRAAGSGRVEVHVRDPAGTSVACAGVAGSGVTGTTQCPTGPVKITVPFATGNWRVTVEVHVLDSTTRAGGEVRLVSIQDRSGTV